MAPGAMARLRSGDQANRYERAAGAKTDIRQPGSVVRFQAEKHVSPRRDTFVMYANAGGQPRHRKAEALEDRCEKRVLFKAVAAAAGADDLGLDAVKVDANWPA